MKVRVLSSVLIGVLLLVLLLAGGYFLAGALLLLSMIAYTEVNTACGVVQEKGFNPIGITGNIGICAHYYCLMWKRDLSFVPFVLLATLLVMLICYVLRYPKYHIGVVMVTFFSFAYAPVMLSFIYLIRVREYGAFLAWLPFVAWVSDSCAYLTGLKYGKRRIFPKLSPKKTLEGCLGGMAGSAVAGAIYGLIAAATYTKQYAMIWVFALIALIASVLSQIGDLVASGIKRDHKVKDYGNLIPGHGGIMDRFDSVIFIAPVVYWLITVLV